MTARPLAGLRLAAACALALSAGACASGGGGGDSPATGVASGASPAPATTPTTSTFRVQSPNTAVVALTAGPSYRTPRAADSNLVVTITDPDGAATVDAVNYDGAQSVRVQFNDGSSYVTYDHTFSAADFQGNSAAQTYAEASPTASTTRRLALSSWQTTNASGDLHQFLIYRLLGGQRSPSGYDSGQPTRYVALGEWREELAASPGGRISGFQLIGAPTDAALMPRSGAASFYGEALGRYFGADVGAKGAEFLAQAALSVDFSKTAGAISGRIDDVLYSSAAAAGPRFDMRLNGDLNGSAFSGVATATGGGLTSTAGGTVQGQFYGPAAAAAAEVGGVFLLGNADGQGLVGGFVGKR